MQLHLQNRITLWWRHSPLRPPALAPGRPSWLPGPLHQTSTPWRERGEVRGSSALICSVRATLFIQYVTLKLIMFFLQCVCQIFSPNTETLISSPKTVMCTLRLQGGKGCATDAVTVYLTCVCIYDGLTRLHDSHCLISVHIKCLQHFYSYST